MYCLQEGESAPPLKVILITI
eukprot:SAG22_NODE_15275_length_352_cov_1.351779_1_plen_20_part_10